MDINDILNPQESRVAKSTDNLIITVCGKSGCVDCDTEFFNGKEWKRIADYNPTDKVLQYNSDGSAELVYPTSYIKAPAEYLYSFDTKYGLSQKLSPEHEVYYITSKGKLHHKSMQEVVDNHNSTGFRGRFITTFRYGGEGIDYSDDYIRLKIAVFADGTFPSDKPETSVRHNYCRMHLKKERKKQRLTELLNRLNIEYVAKHKDESGYTDFYFPMDNVEKHFDEKWYNCSLEQFEIIKDEIFNWDGSYKEQNNYCTTCKSDADFVQFALTSLGYRTSIFINDKKDYIDTFLRVEDGFEPCEELIAEIQKAYDTVTIPQRATKGSAGYDICIPFDYSITPEETLKIPTGIRCKMNNEYVMLIFPRSSLGIKKNMYITNTIPVIDSDYSEADNEGYIFLCVKNGGEQMLDLKAGDAIVQAVFLPYGIADEEEVLTSRTGGIGSTDEQR